MNDYPEIRASLVKFARGTDRPQTLKAHAEVLVTIIDAMAKDPDDPALKDAFLKAYQRFHNAASGDLLPPMMFTPAEIAKRLGLGIRDLQ